MFGAWVRDIAELKVEGGYEIVLVNDGSRDETGAICRELIRTAGAPVIDVEHARNFGKHNAVLIGWRHARGAHLVNLDDGGKNRLAEAVRLRRHAKATGRGGAAVGAGAGDPRTDSAGHAANRVAVRASRGPEGGGG